MVSCYIHFLFLIPIAFLIILDIEILTSLLHCHKHAILHYSQDTKTLFSLQLINFIHLDPYKYYLIFCVKWRNIKSNQSMITYSLKLSSHVGIRLMKIPQFLCICVHVFLLCKQREVRFKTLFFHFPPYFKNKNLA